MNLEGNSTNGAKNDIILTLSDPLIPSLLKEIKDLLGWNVESYSGDVAQSVKDGDKD